jgi:uncharacterized membrane protein
MTALGRSDARAAEWARLRRLLLIVLGLTALDTTYLSWRFLALRAGWVEPGTGICSWSEWIDCDNVLLSSQAHAFYVPNAVLGLGFYVGCLIWVTVGQRLGPGYQPHLVRSLTVWLGVATAFTLYFWWLLIHLPALCPFCPWNHALTYVALGLACRLWMLTPRQPGHRPLGPLLRLVALCVGWFWLVIAAWLVLLNQHAWPLELVGAGAA